MRDWLLESTAWDLLTLSNPVLVLVLGALSLSWVFFCFSGFVFGQGCVEIVV